MTYNERRQRFVEEMVLNGGQKSKAAIAAGASEKSASCLASRYMKEKEVLDSLKDARAELRKKACEVLGISQLTKMQILWKHAKNATPNESIRAIAELNRMTGDYEPAETKSDITSAGEPLSSVVILPENNRNINFEVEEESVNENS